MKRTPLAAVVVLAALAWGCGAPATTPGSSEGSQAASGDFPATVMTCGTELVFDRPPERVLIRNAHGLAVLQELGLLDSLASWYGVIDENVFDAETVARLNSIPKIEGTSTGGGSTQVSTESVLEQRPEVVVGFSGADLTESLHAAGVKTYTAAGFCPGQDPGAASFDWVFNEVTQFGAMFGVPEKAAELNAALAAELPPPATDQGTAAALYLTPGVEKVWVYGPAGMIHPIMEHNGLTNVYADQAERVPEISHEDLLQRNPDTLIILYSEGTVEDVRQTLLGFRGVDQMDAVRNGRIIVMPYSLVDPPSPLSIGAVTTLGEELAALG